jgi:ABC-2 type transport system ATP-binding protein
MNNIVTVKNFDKQFGAKKAVHNLSFEVKKGEVFAFLGANGSGKTTTIRCLLGIMQPTRGELLINGESFNYTMADTLGYLPEERGLYKSSKALETLVYFGQIKGLSFKQASVWAKDFLEKVGLADKAGVEVKKLSSGQQQKIQLGITTINSPELLILDEPTQGLDPVNRSLLLEMLMDLNEKGSTVVFITHQMEEVEKIADRLVMIKEGQRILYGEVDKIKNQFGTNTIHLSFKGEFPQGEKIYTYQLEHNYAEILPGEGVANEEIIKYLIDKNVKINNFRVEAPSLNQIFIKVMSEGEPTSQDTN